MFAKALPLTFVAVMLALPAWAQDRIPSHCIALAQAPGLEVLHHASFGAPLAEDRVRIRYIAHATFVIETSGGLVAATDYTGYLGTADVVPDVVTMNNAHSALDRPARPAHSPCAARLG